MIGNVILSRKNPLARNLVILTIGEILSRVIYAIAFVYIARIFPPVLYGQVEFSLAMLLILTIAVDLGLGVIGTREIAKQVDRTGKLVQEIVSMQFGLAILILIGLSIVVVFLPLDRTLKFLMIGYGISMLGYPLNLNWVFQGWNQMAWVTIPQVVRQTIFAFLILIIIRTPDQVLLIPLIEWVAVLVLVAMNLRVYLHSQVPFKVDLIKAWRSKLPQAAMPVGGSQLIWALRMYLPTIMLAGLAGQTAVGFFGASHRIVMVFQGLLIVYFVNLLPNLSQASFNSKYEFLALLNRSMRFLVWPSLIFSTVVSVFSSRIIHQLYGQPYMRGQTAVILGILIWILPVLVWRSHGRNSLVVIDQQQDEFVCSLIGLLLLIGMIIPFSLKLGGIGTALAMLTSEFLATGLTWWRVRKHLPDIDILKFFFKLPSLSILYDLPSVQK